MSTKLQLINSALILIGDLPLDSLIGTTRAHVVSNALYDNIVQNELSKFRWGFARRQAQCVAAVTPGSGDPIVPLFDYSNSYFVPADMLSLIRLSPSVNYQIYGEPDSPETDRQQVIYTNYSGDLFADYIHNMPENEWPAYFSKMIEYALGMDFAPAIRDSAVSMELLANQYQNASRMARFTDSQQHPQTPIQDRPFIDVRR